MEQQGIVIEITDPTNAKVVIDKHAACGNCGKCQEGKKNTVIMSAKNDLDAKCGDLVEVSMHTRHVLTAAVIMYLFPLILLLIGIFIGNKLFQGSNKEILSILLGFIFLALSYFMIRTREKSFSKDEDYEPIITKIISHNHQIEDL